MGVRWILKNFGSPENHSAFEILTILRCSAPWFKKHSLGFQCSLHPNRILRIRNFINQNNKQKFLHEEAFQLLKHFIASLFTIFFPKYLCTKIYIWYIFSINQFNQNVSNFMELWIQLIFIDLIILSVLINKMK
jgi:hypothetical protein